MSTNLEPAGELHGDVRPPLVEPRKAVPVKWWATLGALILVFMIVILVRWVSGPLFERVPTGPDDPPMYMKITMIGFQALSIPAALGCLYWFAVRPWRRTGQLTTDGALTIAYATLWFQDPLSAYSGHWFVYNSWMVNFGSWVNSIPFATGKAAPGAMVVEPILGTPGMYVWMFVGGNAIGVWVLRLAKKRWPAMGVAGLCGICFLAMFAFDLVFEGIIFMPLGVWEFPGGHFAIFSDHYYKFPLTQMISAGSVFAIISCIKFFKNDRGETLVERGLEQMRLTNRRKALVRTLAMIAMVHVVMFVCYNLTNTWTASRSDEWPADLQQRSYFTNGICGEGTDQMCPGPAVPQFRNDNGDPNGGSAHLNPDGQLVIPPNTDLPSVVPFRK